MVCLIMYIYGLYYWFESNTVYFAMARRLIWQLAPFLGIDHDDLNPWDTMAHRIVTDILIYILEQFLEPSTPYLGYDDLSACSLVCKQWQTFSQDILFRHVFLAHAQQLASFLSAIIQTFPPSSPINKHKRELAHAVRSIRYAVDPPTVFSVLRHCENLVEFQEI